MAGRTTDGIGIEAARLIVRPPPSLVLCIGAFATDVSGGAGVETSLARTSLRLTRAPVFAVTHAGFAELALGFWIWAGMGRSGGAAAASAACRFRSLCDSLVGASFSSEDRPIDKLDFLDEDVWFIISFISSFLSPNKAGGAPQGFDDVVGVLVGVGNSRERGESLARSCEPGLGEGVSMPLPFTSPQPLDVLGALEVGLGCHPVWVTLDGVPGESHTI